MAGEPKTLTFEMSEKETADYRRWYKRHERECGFNFKSKNFNGRSPALGEILTFHFVPHGFGHCISIECACKIGKYKADVTDSSVW